MNGLTTGEEHLKLIAVIFQNIVPPINVNTVSSRGVFILGLRIACRLASPSLLLSHLFRYLATSLKLFVFCYR